MAYSHNPWQPPLPNWSTSHNSCKRRARWKRPISPPSYRSTPEKPCSQEYEPYGFHKSPDHISPTAHKPGSPERPRNYARLRNGQPNHNDWSSPGTYSARPRQSTRQPSVYGPIPLKARHDPHFSGLLLLLNSTSPQSMPHEASSNALSNHSVQSDGNLSNRQYIYNARSSGNVPRSIPSSTPLHRSPLLSPQNPE